MRGILGFLIYLIMILISSLVKRAAQRSMAPGQFPGVPPQEPAVAELEVQAWEPVAQSLRELLPGEKRESEAGEGEETEQDWWPDEEADNSERLAAIDSEQLEEPTLVPAYSRLVEAVIMSEIIREPRALRRWPSR